MPERIPGLDQLADEAKEVTMLPASEIRRRGNRRRTTRRVAAGTVVAALLLTAGVGVWQSPLLDQLRNPQWATTAVPETPEPTVSPTQGSSTEPTDQPTLEPTTAAPIVIPPTWDNAPTSEMFFSDGDGEVKSEYEGPGQAAKGLCDEGNWGDATVTLTREIGVAGDWPSYIDAMTLGYATVDEASEAFDRIKSSALNCKDLMESRSGLSEASVTDATQDVPFDASSVSAEPVRMGYVTYVGLIPDTEEGMWGDTLLLQAGERLVWVTSAFRGMDNNCVLTPDDPDLVQCQLPAAIPAILTNVVKGT